MHPTPHTPHFARSERGFTLAETVIVLAIMAGVIAATTSVVGRLSNAKLRSEAMRMSGALRMVYGRAAINGLRYQVTFDVDSNTYSVECAEENVVIDYEAEAERAERRSRFDDDEEADPFGLGAGSASLHDCSEPLLPSRETQRGVEIDRVLTIHDRDPVDVGSATVAFFPNGFVERSLIWLNQGESFMTLELDPMTGRVIVHAGDLDVPDDFFAVEED